MWLQNAEILMLSWW